MSSNYPPGVTGSEPQITGEWPHEFVADDGGGSDGKYEPVPVEAREVNCLECGEPRDNKMHPYDEQPHDPDWTPEQAHAAGATIRLEYLRAELRSESISYGELAELQSLARFIDPDDTELLEAAGVPEFGPGRKYQVLMLDDLTAEQVDEWNAEPNADPILTCDLCGKREWSGDLTPDWNGETGNHLSCEAQMLVDQDEAPYPSSHRCTKDECGRTCHPDYDGTPLTTLHFPDGDTGGYDADDQPCPCWEHEEVKR